MEPRKLTKEDIDKVRDIEGFPIGTDEDIIALSDAPYYTACPNPFIEEFIRENGTPYDEETDDYHCEPFAADVSEGKSDPIYNTHSYLTKVPHKAIMRYILHYTKPGDLVFDGFCGTGMTGVAAQMCENPTADFRTQLLSSDENIEFGTRYAILNDLSPAATFISANYNLQVTDPKSFEMHASQILDACEKEYAWMFKTKHQADGQMVFGEQEGYINYVIWSDAFLCPNCGEEYVFWNLSVDEKEKATRDLMTCPHCGMTFKKKDCALSVVTYLVIDIQQRGQLSLFPPTAENSFISPETIDNQMRTLIQRKYKSQAVSLSKLQADFFDTYGVVCSSKELSSGKKVSSLKRLEKNGEIEVERMPSERNGTPTRFWSEQKDQKVTIKGK